jgi:hypothetical protein
MGCDDADLSRGRPHVDLLKVDIEGSETQLFQGDQTWLGRVNAIAMELLKPVGRNPGLMRSWSGMVSPLMTRIAIPLSQCVVVAPTNETSRVGCYVFVFVHWSWVLFLGSSNSKTSWPPYGGIALDSAPALRSWYSNRRSARASRQTLLFTVSD